MSRNVQLGQEQEHKALEIIGRYDWLRIQEFSMFIWPNSEHRYHYAKSLIKKLVEQDMVFTQVMPGHAGTCVVLKVKGAKFLRSLGFKKVRSATLITDDKGKSIYELKKNWQHDLMVHGFAALAFQREFSEKFLTEKEQGQSDIQNNRLLATEHDDDVKLTDILIEHQEWGMLGIEFEKSRKTGEKSRTPLIKNLVQVNKPDGRSIHSFGGVEPAKIAFAYDPEQTEIVDGKKKKINHLRNIGTATQRYISKKKINEVEFIDIELKIKNYGVVDYKISRMTMEMNKGIPNIDFSL